MENKQNICLITEGVPGTLHSKITIVLQFLV